MFPGRSKPKTPTGKALEVANPDNGKYPIGAVGALNITIIFRRRVPRDTRHALKNWILVGFVNR